MDIGMIAIQLVDGVVQVVRCEYVDGNVQAVPARNTAALAQAARQALVAQGVPLDADGYYLCPDTLQAAAQFPPLPLPDDAITLGAACRLLYPDVPSNEAWRRFNAERARRSFTVYRTGVAQETRQYVSRAEVLRLMREQRSVPAPDTPLGADGATERAG